MNAAAREAALAYLASHHVMTLATNGRQGPWAAAVFYANAGFDLLFLSAPATRHARNLAFDPHAAVTVQEDYRDWPDIKGVQLEGLVEELAGEEAARARAHYAEKFPLARPGEAVPAPIAAAFDKVRWYRLVAKRAYFVDNAAGFGHRDQVL